MPVTVRNTDILFNDGTTQNTAAGAIPTNFDQVGTYAHLLQTTNSNLSPGATIAGSSLRHSFSQTNTNQSAVTQRPFRIGLTSTPSYNGGGTALSGTWRKMSSEVTFSSQNHTYGTDFFWGSALYVRIS